jgi:hypothetical protein
MNKKILSAFVSLLAVAMLATPLVGLVQAGKGEEKTSFACVPEGDLTNVPIREPDLKPKKDGWAEANVAKTSWTFADITPILLIGGVPYIPDDFDFIGTLIIQVGSGHDAVAKNTWTFEFDEIGTIVVEETGKMDFMTGGIVYRGVGWGTGDLKGVKIDYYINRGGVEYDGTVMGWPTELFT